jgi:hypothetical protein
MSYHRELLVEIVNKWDEKQIDNYITELNSRRDELSVWIRVVQGVKKAKNRKKSTPENGPRDGR